MDNIGDNIGGIGGFIFEVRESSFEVISKVFFRNIEDDFGFFVGGVG